MNDYNINILVNGNKCKKFYNLGKTFIEAKQGSEYAIEIKNNNGKRILAVCSVDGLNIINGKSATEDGPGYVMDTFSSVVFDGFRVSNEKVAKFVFDYKFSRNSYAASKHDGSEENVGVIGIRIFDEKINQMGKIAEEHHHHYHDNWRPLAPTPWPPYSTWHPWTSPWTTRAGPYMMDLPMMSNAGVSTSPTNACGCNSTSPDTSFIAQCHGNSSYGNSHQQIDQPIPTEISKVKPRGFDMGTKWGDAKESRIREVTFERGLFVLTSDIYYASRQSLLEMGIPLGNEKQISFPDAFADSRYATPPSGWQG